MKKKEITSFTEAYENRQEILANPELYCNRITVFSAGDNCSYRTSKIISVAQLVHCWQHEEYQIKCPKCGEVAYIAEWFGKAEHYRNGKLYWEVRAYCPHCKTTDYISASLVKTQWKEMMKLANEIPDSSDEQKFTIADAYTNMTDILEHPEQYTEPITHFSAGGLGACVYRHEVSAAELVRCWQHKKYQVDCPCCKSVAYVYHWAGHINGGGYCNVGAYCPHCLTKYNISGIGHAHWTKMRETSEKVAKELSNNNKENNDI